MFLSLYFSLTHCLHLALVSLPLYVSDKTWLPVWHLFPDSLHSLRWSVRRCGIIHFHPKPLVYVVCLCNRKEYWLTDSTLATMEYFYEEYFVCIRLHMHTCVHGATIRHLPTVSCYSLFFLFFICTSYRTNHIGRQHTGNIKVGQQQQG